MNLLPFLTFQDTADIQVSLVSDGLEVLFIGYLNLVDQSSRLVTKI